MKIHKLEELDEILEKSPAGKISLITDYELKLMRELATGFDDSIPSKKSGIARKAAKEVLATAKLAVKGVESGEVLVVDQHEEPGHRQAFTTTVRLMAGLFKRDVCDCTYYEGILDDAVAEAKRTGMTVTDPSRLAKIQESTNQD